MTNWLATDTGDCQPFDGEVETRLHSPYRLYRLLTDLEDIVAEFGDDRDRLFRIVPRVRQFLTDAQWLEAFYVPPDPKKGWSVSKLYDEPDYPFTVQLVAWTPGATSPIHNHATWGVVAMLDGSEKNSLWRRTEGDAIEKVGDRVLEPGEAIAFTPDAIHCIEALGNTPTVSFNLYGKTDYTKRFEFDPVTRSAKRF
ncbi:cupin [Leptolyngbya valderiana BDU 20041]|nr:cupin [Geitlerinema sp. CS-897]OAB61851.1 cupin [Leptolyngbya valderiana BDU 20041]PPT05840.1 hypothetical protein CKA32_004909 [Geitlerinema sp. FC II]